jgi:hypothetical protein
MKVFAILAGVLLLVPLPALPAPVQTFTSARWGIALDYPAGWTVDDDGDEVRFRSNDADTITLGRAVTENRSEPAPGRRTDKPTCSTTTTIHDVVVTTCVEPSTRSRRAVLVLKTRDGRESRLALSTRSRDARVFDAVVSSARPYP